MLAVGTTSAERFDPATKIWTPTTGSPGGFAPSLVRLPDNRVLDFNGAHYVEFSSVDATSVFDPATNAWSPFSPKPTRARDGALAVVLASGKLLVQGGATVSGTGTDTPELYDPTTKLFTTTSGIPDRTIHSLTALANGGALVAGGAGCDSRADLLLAHPLGTTCSAGGQCDSGFCVDSVCCAASSCLGGAKCNNPGKAGACTKNNGTTCAGATECASGYCVDGVCCNGACGDACAACDVATKVGTCSPVAGAPHGVRAACPSGGGDACKAETCDGVTTTSCKLVGASTLCGADTCKAIAPGKFAETRKGLCDGAGACTGTSNPCNAYACNSTSTACATSCSIAADCAAGYKCKRRQVRVAAGARRALRRRDRLQGGDVLRGQGLLRRCELWRRKGLVVRDRARQLQEEARRRLR